MCQCILCNSTNVVLWHQGVRDNKNMKMYKCQECGLIFCSSYFQKDVINDDLYKNGGMHVNADDYMTIEERKNVYIKEDEKRADEIKEIISNKNVLDFGCSYGGFLDAAKKYAAKVYGCEIEEDAINFCKGLGYDIIEDISDNNRKYDVITLSHVIEHLIAPWEYLKKIITHIKEDGKIILEFPNADEALVSIYECDKFMDFTYWSQHVCLYNEKTIGLLLQKVGLEIEEIRYIERYPLSNHLYWLSQGKPGGHEEWEWMNDNELSLIYEQKLVCQKATDTLMIIAKLAKNNDY